MLVQPVTLHRFVRPDVVLNIPPPFCKVLGFLFCHIHILHAGVKGDGQQFLVMAGKAQLGPVPIFPCEAEGDIRVIVCKALSFIFGGLYRPFMAPSCTAFSLASASYSPAF